MPLGLIFGRPSGLSDGRSLRAVQRQSASGRRLRRTVQPAEPQALDGSARKGGWRRHIPLENRPPRAAARELSGTANTFAHVTVNPMRMLANVDLPEPDLPTIARVSISRGLEGQVLIGPHCVAPFLPTQRIDLVETNDCHLLSVAFSRDGLDTIMQWLRRDLRRARASNRRHRVGSNWYCGVITNAWTDVVASRSEAATSRAFVPVSAPGRGLAQDVATPAANRAVECSASVRPCVRMTRTRDTSIGPRRSRRFRRHTSPPRARRAARPAQDCARYSIDVLWVRRSFISRSMMPASMVTSSAVVGSSSNNKRGRTSSAMAITTRCNCPPES